MSRFFYGADERLRYFQERDLRMRGGNTLDLEGVWEEYRYDPLGRRVLVNTRTKDLCTSGTAFQCASATTRMVWAGDQLLWEIRRSSESPGEESSSAGSYGTVSYTHAGGIDRPLVITKGSTSILPHQNWRGQFGRGTYADGRSSDCPEAHSPNCTPIPWPGHRTTAWHADVKEPDIRVWYGGLVDGMRDASGQQYKRNRYYDPATGQFTQPDPIGIAGGLNSYGFAEGDPVSYSDPYGLGPCTWPINLEECKEAAITAMLEGASVGFCMIGDLFGATEIGEAATGISADDGERIGAGERIRRAGLVGVGIAVPEGRVGANLRSTLSRAQGMDVRVDRVGRFYRATWEVAGERGGASRAVWNKIIDEEGRTVRMYKDSYDRAGRFMHRKFKVPDAHEAR